MCYLFCRRFEININNYSAVIHSWSRPFEVPVVEHGGGSEGMHPGDGGLGIIVTEVNDPPLSHGDLENYRHVLSLVVADGVRGEGGELDASDGGLRTRQRDRKSSKRSVCPLRRLSLVRAVDPSRLKLKPTIDASDVLIDEPVRRSVRKKAERRQDVSISNSQD